MRSSKNKEKSDTISSMIRNHSNIEHTLLIM
jgi:hypothetical protein